MALFQCVVERRLLEVDLARFPKALLALLLLAESTKVNQIIPNPTNIETRLTLEGTQ